MSKSALEPSKTPVGPRSRATAWALAVGGAVVIAVIVLAAGAGTSGDDETSGGDRRAAAVAGTGAATPAPGAGTPDAGNTPDDGSPDGSSGSPPPSIVDPGEAPAPEVAPLPDPVEAGGEAGGAAGVNPGIETGVGAGVELLPLEEEAAGLPASEKLPPLLQVPKPTAAKATGQRVAGLPDVISSAPESTLTSSAVGVTGQTVTASLAATTSAAGMEILNHYVRVFGAVGLSGTPATTSDGTTMQTFYRGNDTVAVTIVTASDGVTAYTLRGLFASRT